MDFTISKFIEKQVNILDWLPGLMNIHLLMNNQYMNINHRIYLYNIQTIPRAVTSSTYKQGLPTLCLNCLLYITAETFKKTVIPTNLYLLAKFPKSKLSINENTDLIQ